MSDYITKERWNRQKMIASRHRDEMYAALKLKTPSSKIEVELNPAPVPHTEYIPGSDQGLEFED